MIINFSNIFHSSLFYIKNTALDLNIVEGHSDYTKFIILGRSRTGSNFLRSLLNSHSQITAFGEIFKNYNSIGWDTQNLPYSRNMQLLIQNDPIKFLETKVFRRFRKHISAVGFKIFYYHAKNENWSPIWSYLKDQTNLKVIHLKRKNILKVHLSHKKAQLNDQWFITSPGQKVNDPILLDEQECLRSFTGTKKWEMEYDLLFKDHPKIDVIYENLSRDHGNEMKRIQAFLEVDYQPTKPTIYKQSHEPLSKQIINYYELKEKFSDTPWAEFFED